MGKSKRSVLTIFMVVFASFALSGCKSSDYDEAKNLAESKKYDEAITAFSTLGDYKDSRDLLANTIDDYVNQLVSSKNFDKALSILKDNATVGDYSGRITEIEDEKALYDTYELALSYFEDGNNNKGFEILDTLPRDYENVDRIYDSYNELKDCAFKGSHRDGHSGDVSQSVKFSVEYSSTYECFKLHIYKAVYWSDGSVYKDYDYYLDADEINGTTIKQGKFTWTVDSSGRITETEKGETTVYR